MSRVVDARRGGGSLAIALAACALLLSCASAGGGEDAAASSIRLMIKDGVLRQNGAECGGTGPLAGVHPTAEFDVVDADGAVVYSGRLPQGTAVKSFDIEVGELAEPTDCQMDISIPGVADGDGLSLILDGVPRAAIIDADANDDKPPLAVIP